MRRDALVRHVQGEAESLNVSLCYCPVNDPAALMALARQARVLADQIERLAGLASGGGNA